MLSARKLERRHSTAGAAAIELALLAPILMLLVLGAVELGRAINHKMQLASAARAGAAYALLSTFDATTDLSGVLSGNCSTSGLPAIQVTMCSATNLTSSAVTAIPTRFCECDGTGGTLATCTDACTGTLRDYITVTVTETFSTVISYPGIETPIALTESLTVRVD